jgi:hypothetical protein
MRRTKPKFWLHAHSIQASVEVPPRTVVKSFRDVNQDGCPFNKKHLTWQYAKALMCVLGVLPKGDDEVCGEEEGL